MRARKVTKQMRLDEFFSGIRTFNVKLKLKWSDYWSDILQSITEGEVGIRHAEYDKHVESHALKAESPCLDQGRKGDEGYGTRDRSRRPTSEQFGLDRASFFNSDF